MCKYPFFRWFTYSHMSNTCFFSIVEDGNCDLHPLQHPLFAMGIVSQWDLGNLLTQSLLAQWNIKRPPQNCQSIYPVLPAWNPPSIQFIYVQLLGAAPQPSVLLKKIWQQDNKRKKLPTSSNPPGWSRPNDFPKRKARNHCVCQTFIFALLKSQETVG